MLLYRNTCELIPNCDAVWRRQVIHKTSIYFPCLSYWRNYAPASESRLSETTTGRATRTFPLLIHTQYFGDDLCSRDDAITFSGRLQPACRSQLNVQFQWRFPVQAFWLYLHMWAIYVRDSQSRGLTIVWCAWCMWCVRCVWWTSQRRTLDEPEFITLSA